MLVIILLFSACSANTENSVPSEPTVPLSTEAKQQDTLQEGYSVEELESAIKEAIGSFGNAEYIAPYMLPEAKDLRGVNSPEEHLRYWHPLYVALNRIAIEDEGDYIFGTATVDEYRKVQTDSYTGRGEPWWEPETVQDLLIRIQSTATNVYFPYEIEDIMVLEWGLDTKYDIRQSRYAFDVYTIDLDDNWWKDEYDSPVREGSAALVTALVKTEQGWFIFGFTGDG